MPLRYAAAFRRRLMIAAADSLRRRLSIDLHVYERFSLPYFRYMMTLRALRRYVTMLDATLRFRC